MLDLVNLIILIAAGLVVLSVFTSLVSQRMGAPLLLVFLIIGILAGEDGLLGISFNDGAAAYFIGSLALAIILYDSGFETRFHSYRIAAAPALVLATLGVMGTAALTGVAARYLAGFDWVEAMLLGCIIASTDAAAVFFLLRVGGISIRERVRATLEIESGTNDPMAIFLTLAFVELAIGTQDEYQGLLLALSFVQQMGIGLLAGVAGGVIISATLNRIRGLDLGLYPIASISAALVVFSIAGLLGGSGFLAAYVAGLVAGNRRVRHATRIRRFQAGMTWLAQIGMFLTLGLLATPSNFESQALTGLLLAFFLIFIARPIVVWLCLWPFGFRSREVNFISWVGLRGAVSIMLAILPTLGGVESGEQYFNLVFIIVLASLLVQGWTLTPVAKLLKVLAPQRHGPVDSQQIELRGRTDLELVGYRIHPESALVTGARTPRWARPSIIIRKGKVYNIHNAGHLQPEDDVYLFASQRQIPVLDKIYAGPADLNSIEYPGEFSFPGDTTIGQLSAIYNLEINRDAEETKMAQILSKEYKAPELGDRVSYGPVELIVLSLDDDGRIATVGISLDPTSPPVSSNRIVQAFYRLIFGRHHY
jgi:potassium/hydrogen antiporter